MTLSNNVSTMTSESFRVSSVTLATSSTRSALVIFCSPLFLFPQVLETNLRFKSLPAERYKPGQVCGQYIHQCHARPVQTHQARLTTTTRESCRQVDRILKVADFIDQLPILGVSAGENAAVRQSADSRNIHIPARSHGFEKLYVHVVNQALKIRLLPLGQSSRRV